MNVAGLVASAKNLILTRAYTQSATIIGSNMVGGLVASADKANISQVYSNIHLASSSASSNTVSDMICAACETIEATANYYNNDVRNTTDKTSNFATGLQTYLMECASQDGEYACKEVFKGFENAWSWDNEINLNMPYIIPSEVKGARVNCGNLLGFEVINDVEDLQNINANPTGSYCMNTDLDMAGVDYLPIKRFAGTFDGNGKTIRNLTYTSDEMNVGLFATISGAETTLIKNLSLENFDISSTSNGNPSNMLEDINVGGLVGFAKTPLILENVKGNGLKITSNGNSGGVIGEASTANLANIQASNLTITSNSNPYNPSSSGGIVGKGEYLLLSNTSSTAGTITSSTNAGGIVGNSTTRMNGVSISATDLTLLVDTQTDGSLGKIGGVVAVAENIKLTKSYVENLTLSSLTEYAYIGGIAGQIENNLELSDSYVSSTTISSISTNASLGGLVGYLDIADINLTTSYVNAGVSSTSTNVGMIYSGIPLQKSFTNIYYNLDGLNT